MSRIQKENRKYTQRAERAISFRLEAIARLELPRMSKNSDRKCVKVHKGQGIRRLSCLVSSPCCEGIALESLHARG